MGLIWYLTNADSEILAIRLAVASLAEDPVASGLADVRVSNPTYWSGLPDIRGAEVVVVRLLGGSDAWEGVMALREICLERGIPFIALGGEAMVDPAMTRVSSVPEEAVLAVFSYCVAGGVENMAGMIRFLSELVRPTGREVPPPVVIPEAGVWYATAGDGSRACSGAASSDASSGASSDTSGAGSGDGRVRVGIVFYRAHLLSGNTQFVADLCSAIEDAGGDAVAVWCYSLRSPDHLQRPEAVSILEAQQVDVVITTVLSAGFLKEAGESWDPSALADLGVVVLQAVAATGTAEEWMESTAGLRPVDVAMSVAIPEFDGRVVGPAFSFKAVVDSGGALGHPIIAYRTVSDRCQRVASMAVAIGRLRGRSVDERRVAVMLSAYPTKRGRIGNAVGLDTPASAVDLLAAMRMAGYEVTRIPVSGDSLMAELADALSETDGGLMPDVSSPGALGYLSVEDYEAWFSELPAGLRDTVLQAWGPVPGEIGVVQRSGNRCFTFPGIDLGNVSILVQPSRGYGANPIAIYHSPDLPPTHYYLACYRWLSAAWGADVLVHLGKHGTLEWLPGKGVGLSASCGPDAALGSLPLVYPFVVNDPGEGTQAKRRSHAVIVDHLVPPLTRADVYDDLARLEALLDEHASCAALDPAKLPVIRQQIHGLLVASEIHRDIGLGGDIRPDESLDDYLRDIDGYLCELKDAQIRGGLHVLGRAPRGDALVDFLLAVTRLPQGDIPSLRVSAARAIGCEAAFMDESHRSHRRAVDQVEALSRSFVSQLQARDYSLEAVPEAVGDAVARGAAMGGGEGAMGSREGAMGSREGAMSSREVSMGSGEGALSRREGGHAAGAASGYIAGGVGEGLSRVGSWICSRLVPAIEATTDEIASVLDAVAGLFVEPGPSGAPSRGMAHVLPTGRNFYAIDPRAIPSRLSWDVGRKLADQLVARYAGEEGRPPRHVALVLWGTAAMRTGGDDVAEALALLGVRPLWESEAGRVAGLEVMSLEELGRPRVDVTMRVSGFFRDAFPHVLAMLDEASSLVAELDEPASMNPLRADQLRGDRDPRIFGPKPGSYGSGILNLLEQGGWSSTADLAEVYLEWSGWAYGAGAYQTGVAARPALERRLGRCEVAVKNQDNREHDIFDSDDYLQDHGGMVAAINALAGESPRAWFGDSADPERPRVRPLAEEAARVARTRACNPKWIRAMQSHGYKGAFEMAATVDYIYGYDATTGIVAGWIYEELAERYLGDPKSQEFFRQSNPWAYGSIAERLLEAQMRGLWEPSDRAKATLEAAILRAEGWEEDR